MNKGGAGHLAGIAVDPVDSVPANCGDDAQPDGPWPEKLKEASPPDLQRPVGKPVRVGDPRHAREDVAIPESSHRYGRLRHADHRDADAACGDGGLAACQIRQGLPTKSAPGMTEKHKKCGAFIRDLAKRSALVIAKHIQGG